MDIFTKAFKQGGVFAMKCCPPYHKNTPKPVQSLSHIHHGLTKQEFDGVEQSLTEMSDESYEYSRLGIYFAVDHILEELHELKIGFGSLISFENNVQAFKGLFNNMDDYFSDIANTKSKKVNKNKLQAKIEAVTSYVEGVMLLKRSSEKDKLLAPLVQIYEEKSDILLNQILKEQENLKNSLQSYEIITIENIYENATQALEKSLSFEHTMLRRSVLERIKIDVGDRNTYWYALQDDKKWTDLYKNDLQSISKHTLEKLRVQLPEIINQYKSLRYLSFTNMIKVLALASNYYGESISANNENKPKNDEDYRKQDLLREQEIEEYNKNNLHSKYFTKTQTPEITHENLKFSSEILSASMNLTMLLNQVSGISNDDYLFLEKHNEYDILRKTNSEMAVIFYNLEKHLYACTINTQDLKTKDIEAYRKKTNNLNGNSYYGMSHFLSEIKEQFTQEYFFGKHNKILDVIDKRKSI